MATYGIARQSRTTDKSISLEAQKASILAYDPATEQVSTDPSTSGGISIFDRPGASMVLGLVQRGDVLAATKLDRLCRDTTDYMKLRDWCRERGVRIVLLNQPELDESTPAGRAMASLMAVFAEFEREMIRERARERHATMTELGRWTGGRVPFGTKPVQRDGGWYLEPDADSALAEMVAMAIGGATNVQICRWLNDNGIASMLGRAWRATTVGIVLNRAAKSDEELASALAARPKQDRGAWTSGRHMLLKVAFCAVCQTTLYGNLRGGKTPMYRCMGCNRSVAKTWLESRVEAKLRARWGARKYQVPRVVKGDDHSTEVRRLRRQLDQIKGMPFVETTQLEEEIARLSALPHVPETTEWIPTEELISDHWDSLSLAERGPWLRQHGVKALVKWEDPPPSKPIVAVLPTWEATGSGWV